MTTSAEAWTLGSVGSSVSSVILRVLRVDRRRGFAMLENQLDLGTWSLGCT